MTVTPGWAVLNSCDEHMQLYDVHAGLIIGLFNNKTLLCLSTMSKHMLFCQESVY